MIVAADATPTTLEALSRGRTVVASAQRGVATSVASAATISSTNPASTSSTASTALGAGWLRPTAAQAANAKRVAVAMRPSTKPAKAPIVKVPAKRVVALQLKRLTAGALYIADVKLAGKWTTLGAARATTRGLVALPAFSATKPGTYLLRLTATGQPPLYLKVQVGKKRAAP